MNLKRRVSQRLNAATVVILFSTLCLLVILFSGVLTPLVRVVLAADRTGTYSTGGFTFAAPQELTGHPPSPLFFQGDAEPEIKIDLFGDIYVTAIQGVPGGTDFWKSTTQGASFVYMGQPDGLQDHCNCPVNQICNGAGVIQCGAAGGGDDSIDVSSGGYLYVSSLWLGNVTTSTSMDGGTGGAQPGQAWTVNPAAASVAGDDRQWIAHYGPQTVYMSYTDIPTGAIEFEKSIDAGKTWSAPVQIYNPVTGSIASDLQGNIVVDPYNGNIYVVFIPLPGVGTHTHREVWIARSSDGGTTWTLHQAYQGPPNTDNGQVFPAMAVDRGGNLHIAVSRCDVGGSPAHTNCQIYMVSSPAEGTNGVNTGNTWLDAVRVSNGADTTTAVEPAITAGSPGIVDVAWLGSTVTSPDIAPSDVASQWRVFFAQTTNALSANPTFNQVQVTGPMHDQDICFNGLACASNPSQSPGNRDLLEYFSMTLDPEGNANIAYADSVNNCPSATCVTNTWYTKQTVGQSAYAPPAAPAAATFGTNLTLGMGAEPNIRVDSDGNIYAAAIATAGTGPGVWKSTNNGTSFSFLGNFAGTGATGGDADIMPITRATGAGPDPVYLADLGITTIHIKKSTDGTMFPDAPAPANEASASADRMWFAWDRRPNPLMANQCNQIVYLNDHEFASEEVRVNRSLDDGAWEQHTAMTDPELQATLNANTNPGNVFVDRLNTHNVYTIFAASTNQTNVNNPPFGKLLNIWIAVSTNSGLTFVNHPVFKGLVDSESPTHNALPGAVTFGTNVANIFPVGDVDAAGNIYVAWAMNNARTNTFDVWYVISHDQGQNFYGPFQVSQDVGTHVFPWMAAGSDGKLDVVWYGSGSVSDPNTLPITATWNLFFAQSQNARDREPVFKQVQAGDHVLHNGPISTGGLFGSSDRSLLDFFQVALDPQGFAHIIYADNGASPGSADAQVVYAKQTGGPNAGIAPSFTTFPCAPTAAGGIIRGRIIADDGMPLGGVLVTLNGSRRQSAITSSDGSYHFDNLESAGFYTVTPYRANYSFAPATRSFSLVGSSIDAPFTAIAEREIANPLDTDMFFVRQQYLDFLDREPDAGGIDYWSAKINECGGDASCVNRERINVAAAFFMEREFQETGSFVYRTYKASYGSHPGYQQYVPDRSKIVGGSQLEKSKQQFIDEWVTRADFRAAYPDSLTPEQFVNKLFDTAGLSGYADEQQHYINQLKSGGTRAEVLEAVVENTSFAQREYNNAFVLMQYFGYLRRDPDEAGLEFWLDVLNNREPGNYRGMVCSFITSAEYQKRFSSVISHSNAECAR